jgi:hypothetical protein
MPSDPRDYQLDISSLPASDDNGPKATPRPFLSVHFTCCGVYQRIYRAVGSDCYQGRCPRCQRQITFLVGEGGTTNRFFRVE